MESGRIENYLECLLSQTKANKIFWRPINEFFKYFCDNSPFYNYINIWCLRNDMEQGDMEQDRSFFVKKDNNFLAIIDVKYKNGNNEKHIVELVGSFMSTDSIIQIPPYLDGGIEELHEAILNYWDEKHCTYSPIVNLLEVFTS